MSTMPAVCSKQMSRGRCKREVVFYAEFFGRRNNACVVHLGEILLEQQLGPVARASVFLRPTPTTPPLSGADTEEQRHG